MSITYVSRRHLNKTQALGRTEADAENKTLWLSPQMCSSNFKKQLDSFMGGLQSQNKCILLLIAEEIEEFCVLLCHSPVVSPEA